MADFTQKKPLVYRLEEIPTVTSKNDLLLLFPPKTRDRMTITSLSPSINLNRRTLTATISFLAESEEPFPTPSDPDICVDRDFYGFTPLYTPDGHTDVDIIAITGLAGHAFGSWSTATQRMWLRDFLPRDLPQARVLLYGYDSHIVNSQSRSILADFSSNFIAKFNAMRSQSHSEDRPVIFIGHSLGCLIIKEVLIDLGTYLDHRGAQLRPTVKSIIFFGAPHRGLEATAMQLMVQGTPSEYLIRELEMQSPTLRKLNDGFRRVYGDVGILTIYEMEPTASLRMNESDIWERTGPPVMMVESNSALLHWPMEEKIGLNQDHSRIAKVDRGQNGCYDYICHFLQKSLRSTHEWHTKPNINPRPHSYATPSSSKKISETGRRLCKTIKKGDSKTAGDLVQSVEKGWLAKLGGDPLDLAVEHCPEIVSTLLDAGVDLSARIGKHGVQAIHTAGRYAKNPDAVRILLDAGADVNARDNDDWTPLHSATYNNNGFEIAQTLINAGADVNVISNDKRTPLHLATHKNSLEIIQALINANADVNAKNKDNWTSLHVATRYNSSLEIVQALINVGADVNVRKDDDWMPLHSATRYNNSPEIVQALIDAGADVNAKAHDDWTPLHLATRYNNSFEVVQALIDAGAYINARNDNNWTALHMAARYNSSIDFVKALIKANTDVNATTYGGRSPLFLSVLNDNPTICRELLAAGAHPNDGDRNGCTALHRAVQQDNKATVSLLLEGGADPQAMSKDGITPKDQEFNESIPTVTRSEIRKLISKATRS